MAIHNVTILFRQTSQTKLTITVTLTLTDTVTVIFMRTPLTPIKRFYRINKRNFSRRCVAGFVGGAFFAVCLKIEIHKVHEIQSNATSAKYQIHEICKLYEIHLPKHRNPQHLSIYKIHCLKVKINRTDLWHMISKLKCRCDFMQGRC